ncbi:hypothetical protein [Pseudomonas sp. CC6-YY-74]|uniref:hypothetical protein n=1 Tax=Pseudomonas sp. CC6-YY-74 TaxID=1930532 RepID=UPI0012ABCA77|nr:hypothetical protein [Pseudomonas sp. CC6-YY-74]
MLWRLVPSLARYSAAIRFLLRFPCLSVAIIQALIEPGGSAAQILRLLPSQAEWCSDETLSG